MPGSVRFAGAGCSGIAVLRTPAGALLAATMFAAAVFATALLAATMFPAAVLRIAVIATVRVLVRPRAVAIGPAGGGEIALGLAVLRAPVIAAMAGVLALSRTVIAVTRVNGVAVTRLRRSFAGYGVGGRIAVHGSRYALVSARVTVARPTVTTA